MIYLKRIREQRGLTQAQLAELAGVDRTLVVRYENGKGNPTQKTLEKLANALGVDIKDLI